MEVKVRKATLSDLDILNDFLQLLIQVERPMDESLEQEKHITYYDISEFIKSNDAELFVATINNEIVGSGYGLIKQNKNHYAYKEHGYVGFMFVKEEHRGKGISKLILTTIFDWFKSRGIKETRLEVYQENPSAIKAYEKVGFKKNLIKMLHYLD